MLFKFCNIGNCLFSDKNKTKNNEKQKWKLLLLVGIFLTNAKI